MKRELFAFGLALFAARASEASSLWDRVRDPNTRRNESAMVEALRARTPTDIPPDVVDMAPEFESLLALRAATVLEMRGGAALHDPEVSYFLGDALVTADRGRDEDARNVLLSAIAMDPSSPETARAWFDIAIASNRLHEFEHERQAYDEALRVEWDGNKRAGIYMNRGEASMSLGDLTLAEKDYQIALATTDESEIHALAAWGLAVALARDENLPDALKYAYEASQMTFREPGGRTISALELPGVFFTPDYEVLYYRALAEMAIADKITDEKIRKPALERALADFREYILRGKDHGDRWLTNAEFHRTWAERRLRDGKRKAR